MTEQMEPTEPTFPGIGSVSWGTHRPQDLIPRFLDVLRNQSIQRAEAAEAAEGYVPGTPVPAEAWGNEDHEWWQSEDAQEYLAELFDAMDELAPAYVTFGAQEGDGADFGFWPLVDAALEDDDRVAQLADCPRTVRGNTCLDGEPLDEDEDWETRAAAEGWDYVISITDHGNATLYEAIGNGIGDAPRIVGYREVWAVV